MEAKAGIRFDLDALGLETAVLVNSVALPLPGTMYLAVQGMLLALGDRNWGRYA